jgi:DNA-binding HxlR family transcriptional regulator
VAVALVDIALEMFGDFDVVLLSEPLDEFEEAGLISRTQYNEIPPRVEHPLTDDGDEVRIRLEPLLEWASAAE